MPRRRRPLWQQPGSRFLRRSFGFWERLGLHVTPVHFHQPIPDVRRLPDRLWTAPSELVGVELDADAQLRLLDQLVAYRDEYDRFPRGATDDPHEFFLDNGAFVSVDAEVAYSLVRHTKPRRVVEVGSGFSTLLTAAALRANQAEGAPPAELVAIEPYPRARLRTLPGLTRLVERPVQEVPLDQFTALDAGDVLFIDSSHVVATGSDVVYEFLEVLPRLQPGVLVHVHDIFLPAEYPREWITKERRFWTEQYLLQAFLAFNRAFEVVWAASYLHLRHPDALRAAFASYDPATVVPGSLWLRRTHA